MEEGGDSDMVIDEEGDRVIWLGLLEQSNFPGKFAETVVRLKMAVREAAVERKADGSDLQSATNGQDHSQIRPEAP